MSKGRELNRNEMVVLLAVSAAILVALAVIFNDEKYAVVFVALGMFWGIHCYYVVSLWDILTHRMNYEKKYGPQKW